MTELRYAAFHLLALVILCASPAHAVPDAPQKQEIFLQLGHTGLVHAIAVSPDGKLVASGDFSGLVKFWDAASGLEIGSFLPEGMPIFTLAWSPGGSFLYAGTADGRVLWLDAVRMEKRGEQSCVDGGRIRELRALAVAPDSTRLACGNTDGNVTVFDALNGQPLATLDTAGQGINALAFSRDGSRLFGGGTQQVWNWTMADGKRGGEIGVPDVVSNLALLPDGRRIAVSFGLIFHAKETAIRIYDWTTGTETLSLTGANGGTYSLAVGSDGKRLYSGMFTRMNPKPKKLSEFLISDFRIHEWSLDSGALVRTLDGHANNVSGLALSPDGQMLYSSSWDHAVRAWSLGTGSGKVYSGRGIEPAGVFATDSSWSAMDDQGRLLQWNLDTGAIQDIGAPVPAGSNLHRLRAAVMSPRGPVALVHDPQGELAVAHNDAQGQRMIDVIKPDLRAWASPEIAAKFGLSGSRDEYAIAPLLSAAALSPDGRLAFIGIRYLLTTNLFAAWSRVAVWNVAERRLSGFLPGVIEGDISALSPTHDGKTLLLATAVALKAEIGGPNRYAIESIRIRDGHSLWRREVAATRPIEALAVGHDDRTAAIAKDFVAEVFDVATGKVRRELIGHSKLVSAVAFAPDGKSIATGGVDAAIRLWDAASGKELRVMTGHTGSVRSLAFLKSRGWLISASADRTIKIWGAADGTEVVTLAAFKDGDWAALTNDGFFAASSGGAQQVGFRVGSKLYQLDQFYDLFYRPDLVRRKLGGEAITALTPTTVARALAAPPPDIRAELPANVGNNKEILLGIRAASTGGGIGDIRVFHNGKLVRSDGFLRPVASEHEELGGYTPQAITRRLAAAAEQTRAKPAVRRDKGPHFEERIRIRPVAGVNEIAVAAFNGDNSVQSRFLTKRFVSTVDSPPPRLHVVSIGINAFRAGKNVALKYAAKDARDVVAFVKRNAGRFELGKHGSTHMLLDANASKAKILDALSAVAKLAGPQDALLLFVATHGVISADSYNFITYDYQGELGPASTVSAAELLEALKHIGAQRQIVVLDTCHAGGVNRAIEGLYDARMTVLARNAGLHVLASSGSMEQALDGFGGNGLFTHVLLNGLKTNGADSNRDQRVSVLEIGEYSRGRVESIARDVGHYQTPLILRHGKDYTVLRTE